MKLAELIIADARERGLEHFFGLPGSGSPMDMLEAGRKRGVEFVSVAHESSAAIMAAYNGMMRGTAGLSVAVKGVGAGNMVGGAVNAYFERVPVVCVCEASSQSVKQREMVQHCNHTQLYSAVTKFQATLAPESAAATLCEAVTRATDGRPGPVLLDIPIDQGGAESGERLSLQPAAGASQPAQTQIDSIKQLLDGAKKPLVVAGADVLRDDALAELKRFVEEIEAAVMVTMEARGVFDEKHPRWAGVLMGMFGPNLIETELLSRADLVILVGVDQMMSHTPWNSSVPTCELVSRSEYKTLSPQPSARVDGDLRVTLSALTAGRSGFAEQEIVDARRNILKHFERPGSVRLAAQDIISVTRSALPDDGILFAETGVFVCMLEHLWPVTHPGTFFGTSGGRTMGLTLPAILGAKLARPELPMIGIGGDGSLLMRLGELEAFARTGVAVPLVIINDQALGTMKSRQRSRGLAEYQLDLAPVNFADIARSCGLLGNTVHTPEEFEESLRAAMQADKSTLIDARVDPRAYQDSFGPTIGVLD